MRDEEIERQDISPATEATEDTLPLPPGGEDGERREPADVERLPSREIAEPVVGDEQGIERE